MIENTTHYKSIAFVCVSICIIILFIGFAGCASIPQQPTTINCPAVDTSSLKGVFKGKWKGVALNAADVYGEFEITISADGKITGKYTGSAWGDISGCIDAKGNIIASGIGSGGEITWMGDAAETNGNVFASGTWKYAAGKGTWSGQK